MIFHTLDQVLGSTTKVRILRALMPLYSPVSGNEARALSGVRSKNGLRVALDQLTELGILQREHTGRIGLFRINRDHDLAGPLEELFAIESARISRLRTAIAQILDKGAVGEHTLSIILFGSNARGEARPGSDVDLLVVTDTESRTGAVERVLMEAEPELRRRFGLRIAPYVLDRARVRERHRDGDALMQNIQSEGRTLYGTQFNEIVGEW